MPYQRPDDYYAEMVKTDDHMRKVRQNLLSRQKVLEQKEKARKMRELKKYGKKASEISVVIRFYRVWGVRIKENDFNLKANAESKHTLLHST